MIFDTHHYQEALNLWWQNIMAQQKGQIIESSGHGYAWRKTKKRKITEKEKKHYKYKQNTFPWEQGDQNNNLILDISDFFL